MISLLLKRHIEVHDVHTSRRHIEAHYGHASRWQFESLDIHSFLKHIHLSMLLGDTFPHCGAPAYKGYNSACLETNNVYWNHYYPEICIDLPISCSVYVHVRCDGLYCFKTYSSRVTMRQVNDSWMCTLLPRVHCAYYILWCVSNVFISHIVPSQIIWQLIFVAKWSRVKIMMLPSVVDDC